MSKVQRLMVSSRSWKIVIDAVAIFLGFMVALAVRYDFRIPSEYFANFWLAIPAVVAMFLFMNLLLRIYSGRWKYASFDELLNLASAATISTSLTFFLLLVIPGTRRYVPISVAVMGGVLSLFVMAFARLQYRLLSEIEMAGVRWTTFYDP